MTFAELKAELVARGFDSLSTTRQGYLINNARAELDRMFLWPWREKSESGPAPLSIADLGTIEAVTNTSVAGSPRLQRADYRTLLDSYGDLSTSAAPEFYYVAWPSGTPEVATFPTNSDDIGVQYWRVTPDLTGVEEPASPDQAHYLIVDLAVRRAYRDNDEHDNAAALQPEIDNAVQQLLEQYPPGIADGPDAYVGVSFQSEDW